MKNIEEKTVDTERFNDLISQGIALMTEEKYEPARDTFKNAVELNTRSFEARVHLGNAYANLGEFEEALKAFKSALVLEPKSGEILFSIGNTYLLKDESYKAVEYFNRAEEAGYKTADLYQVMAGIFLDANDISQALRCITRAISVSPFDGELRLFKIRIYLVQNRFDEALDALDDFQRILPDALEVYDLKAQIYCGLKKYEKALEICKTGTERFPEDAKMALIKLKVLVEMGKDSEAEVLLKTMKEKGQYMQVIKDASIQETIIALRKNDIESALETLETANRILNMDSDILYLMVDILGKTEQYKKVIEISELLIEMNAGDFYTATAKYFYATGLENIGKKEDAMTEYKKLTAELRKLTINTPSFYEGYIYRLLCHLKVGEYDKALELADYLENINPEQADSHAFRYFVYKEQGDMVNAEKEKVLAKTINPELNM